MESSKKRQRGSSRSTESKEPIITPQLESCKRARLMILKMETARHARQRRRIIMYKKRMVNKFCSINKESSKKHECGSSRSPESNKPISIPQPKSCVYSHSVVGLNGDVITTTTVAVEEVLRKRTSNRESKYLIFYFNFYIYANLDVNIFYIYHHITKKKIFFTIVHLYIITCSY
jgi:hypothetical protein